MKYFTLATAALLAFIGCSDSKNPYLARADSGVRLVSSSFSHGDTKSIFSTESLMVVLNLKEYIDSFALRTPANRLWSGTDTVVSTGQFGHDAFTFKFSFYDTGWQEISIIAYLTIGDSVEDRLSIYARSPLRQATIAAGIGDTVQLSTPPVNDNVLYVWDFGDGTIIRNNANHASYVVKAPLSAGTGQLYVADQFHRSPSVAFTITAASAVPVPVRFLTEPIDLPDSLTAVRDTLRLGLRIDVATGAPPMRYSAWIVGGSVLLSNSTSPVVLWAPGVADTGVQSLACAVSDSRGTADTVVVQIRVVPVIDPPEITVQPASQTVRPGATATFRIVATGSRLAYQWQRNNVDIPGANSSSYTTPAVSRADDKARYRCIVGNSAGSDTSSAATLTVNAHEDDDDD